MIRFTKAKSKPKIKPKNSKNAILNKLKSFLKAEEPETVEILLSGWNAQTKNVTYQELREAYLSGGMTQKQFLKWQKDYSKLVNTTLAAKWQQAAEAAAQEVKAKYPYFVYEPSVSAGMNFIKAHGAELVTNLAQEQMDALNAIVAHCSGYTAITPDEAARMMRPCIGLTKPQALANVRYREAVKTAYLERHPHGKSETADKKAAEAAAKYAAKQHRYRAMNIARTELAFAYNAGSYGATKDAQAQGYIGDCLKIWVTADDERVCPHCSAMENEKRNMDEPFSCGKIWPPAHPSCHCAVAYDEIPDTNLNTAAQNGLTNTEENGKIIDGNAVITETPPNPSLPKIPPDISVPDGMNSQGKINLGGTGEMYLYKDADGKEWLFKPAQSKTGTPELFRAYSQEAGYKVQSIVDPDTAVPVGTGTLNGTFGAFQRRISVGNGVNYKGWQYSLEDIQIPPETLEQFQREHVTDWLLGNFDSHGGNFITDTSGRIIGIDKEQAFKYLKDPASRKMSYFYHPNAKYGETEPIYNTIYRKFAHGEIDLNPQNTLKYIKRVEAIPDAEYREIFRNYAEGVCGKGKAAEQLLDSIVERKAKLRKTYKEFYSDLMTERAGTKQTFQWADELAGSALPKKPKAAPLPKPKTSKPKTAKPKKPKTTAAPIPQAAPQRSESGYKISEVLDDLSVLPQNQNGVAVRSDGGMVEGLNLTGRRINIDGAEYYEFSGKLTEESWIQAAKNIKNRGYNTQMDFLVRDTSTGFYSQSNEGMKLDAYRMVTQDQGIIEVYSDCINKKQFGMCGFFRARVPVTGNAAADSKAMKEVFDRAGLKALTSNPTEAEELLLRKSRLAWQHNPKAMEKCRYLMGEAKEKEINEILKKAGISDKRIKNMKLKEVFPGYSTYVDDTALAKYRKVGATHIWAGVEGEYYPEDGAKSIVAIFKSDGLTATNYRILSGMKKCGASPGQDMLTGGSDNVFTRIGVLTSESYSSSYLGKQYRIIIDPAELNRTDWYAYTTDNFGVSNPNDSRFQKRLDPLSFIQQMKNGYISSNEIMFRHGISSKSFIGISCDNNNLKDILINEFKSAGITEIRGIPVDDFVQVTKEINMDSLRGVQGLNFYSPNKP